MDIKLVVALITAVITACGWFATYYFSARASRRGFEREAALRHLERQLEDLYGPLAFLILEGRQTFKELLAAFNRNYVFIGDQELPAEELKTWLFWVENDFFPRNEKIKTLLSTKTHLLNDSFIPESFQDFLDHYNSWRINHLRWKSDGVKYSWHSKINWPTAFEEEVLATFRRLKTKHAELAL
jgi:hypothetical protein